MKKSLTLLLTLAALPILGGCHFDDEFSGHHNRRSAYVGRSYHHDEGAYYRHRRYDDHDYYDAPHYSGHGHHDGGYYDDHY